MEFTIEEYNEEPQNTINASEQNKYQESIQNTEQNVFEEVLLCKPVTTVKRNCEHGKQKHRCLACGGSSFCEHNKRKTYCETCGGSELCIHKKRKARCRECNGTEFCIHKIFKTRCRECHGTSFCVHNRLKTSCFDCKGGSICEHNKIRSRCVPCRGSQICIHNINKLRCKDCDGRLLCKTPMCETPMCETSVGKKYEGYCLRCFVYTHPDKPNARNYKTKERTVVDIVLAAFPNFTWVADKKVADGCSRRRPDLFLDMGSHVIIVEVDENQHTDYDCSCENKRLMEISQDIGHRPIIFIRFNPDDYTDQSGTKVKSCFAADKSGIFKVAKSKVADWNMRTNALLQQIAYWSETPTTKTVEVVQLFYDSFNDVSMK
jgi:hypothetical protein